MRCQSLPSQRHSPGVSLASGLWAANADLAQLALRHPFVSDLARGTLKRASFQLYVGQDAFFLEAFIRAYALALARSPDRGGLREFSDLIGGVLDELQLHAGYAESWGLRLEDVVPTPATKAYCDFLLATASLQGVGHTCAAMTPCMRLYAFLGQSLATEPRLPANPYQQWIDTYAAPAFEALAARLERLLEHYASAEVRDTYRRAMYLEVGFFDACVDARSSVRG